MVVWEHEYSPTDRDIYAREYHVDGTPSGNYFTIASWTEDSTHPAIAGKWPPNSEWLAVWQQALPGGTGNAVKGFRWASSVGIPTYFFDVANYAFWDNGSPAIASGFPGYLIVYEGDSSMTNRHIFGRIWVPNAIYLPIILR